MSSSEFGIGDQNLCTLLAGLELQLIWTSQFTPFVRQQFVGPGAEGTRPTTNKAFMETELEQRPTKQPTTTTSTATPSMLPCTK